MKIIKSDHDRDALFVMCNFYDMENFALIFLPRRFCLPGDYVNLFYFVDSLLFLCGNMILFSLFALFDKNNPDEENVAVYKC